MPTSPTSNKSQSLSKSQIRTAEIYRVAANLIHEKGFEATSMNDIAKRLKLTKAGLYYYIHGKRDLLYSIIKFGMQKLEEQVIIPSMEIEDPEERLKQIIEKHTLLILELGGSISILTDEVQSLTPPHRRIIVAMKRDYMDFVRETLRQLRAQKKLNQLNINIASMNIFAIIVGVARWHNPKKGWSKSRVAREITKFATAAVLR